MISYEYHKDSYPTFTDGIKREWAITNGIGGYAGSSLIGAHNRTHQGYLIASLHAPTERYLIFSKINESCHTGGTTYSLETSQHLKEGKTVFANGQNYLTSFSYDGSVHYTYEFGDIILKKHMTLKLSENVCAISYEIKNNGLQADFSLVPLFNFREHSASSTKDSLQFKSNLFGRSLCLIPDCRPEYTILFQSSDGTFETHAPLYDENMQLQTEVDLETDGLTATTARLNCPLPFLPTVKNGFPCCAL